MTKIGFQYEDMNFTRQIKEGKDIVVFSFFKFYYFEVLTDTLREIAEFEIDEDGSTIFFECSEKHMINKMSRIIEEGFSNLYNKINGKRTIYITEDSGIPLIGSNEFGVIDRGTNVLEVKPLTGCNLNCIYCSVDEGINKKLYDYIIDFDYIVKVVEEIMKIKDNPVEVNIGPHGEPLLYPKIIELVKGLKEIGVSIISVNTNGTLLNKELIDELVVAGLTRINLSINSLDQELANKLAGKPYPLKHVLKMLDYGKNKIAFLIAPVIIPGINDDQIKPLLKLSQTIKSEFPTIGFQNYLIYDKGRKPVKEQRSWNDFYKLLEEANKDLNAKITFTNEDFKIHEDNELKRSMRKDEVIDAEIVMPGRYRKEYWAKANNRVINLPNVVKELKIGQQVRIKIFREKHNIYKGQLLK